MRGLRRLWPLALVLIAVAALLRWFVFAPRQRLASVESPRLQKGRPAWQDPAVTPRSWPQAESAPAAPAAEDAPGENAADSEDGVDEMGAAWAAVDMAQVRTAMPDNLYFQQAAPTKDPQVEERREAERERWNTEYGKILSGTATEEEIRAYYDHRARLSGDYIEFTTYLLDHYGGELPERDIGLLELARRLHQARLEEVPRKMEEALERKGQQDAARAAWLADEAAFQHRDPGSE